MAKAKNLVIVESPAKSKTIGKYLGPDFVVKASMGHLRDLPKSTMGVDIENDFEPKYINVKDKGALITELKKDAKAASVVYLATDPDREGEAISWHLKELLGLSDEKAKRVTFNEITRKVVTESIQNPREIDRNLVDAQQARRVLDRLVGYSLSPLLWKSVKSGLSAGRVQSVATRMVVDREKDINAFVSEEFWHLDAKLTTVDEGRFTARFYGVGEKKTELHSEAEVNTVIEACQGEPFVVSSVKRSDKSVSPAPPFITSTLQQEASRRLNMTPRRTMSIAQQLYEGVEINGRGSIGLITYMRTDSLRLSEEALSSVRSYIRENYGAAFCPDTPKYYKQKAGAQDAHEAIRPTDVTLSPDQVRKDLTREQYSLYKLIWERFTACQMANASYDNITVKVSCAGYSYRAGCANLKFKGFTVLYKEQKDEEEDEISTPLPELTEGTELKLEKIIPDRQFTQPPARYTEATLIRAMEEKGIGRPSTYAPTISTIISHDYVSKEGKYLKPTPLGQVVNGLMEQYFADIVDLKFTNQMESRLDSVESGEIGWRELMRSFYTDFSAEFENAKAELVGKPKIPIPQVFAEGEFCDVCGKPMVEKKGRFGKFLACSAFPECTFTKPIVIEMPGKCPKCGGRILKRTSGNGYVFYACEKGKEACGFITWDVPTKDFCPACGKTMFKPGGRGPLKSFCVNTECMNFVPEEDRRYKKKKATADAAAGEAEKKDSSKKSAAKGSKTASGKKDAAGSGKKPAKSGKTGEKKTRTTKKQEG